MKSYAHALRSSLPVLALAVLLPALAGCPGVIEFKGNGGPVAPDKSTVAPILFESFEKGVTGTYTYGPTGAGAKCVVSVDDSVAHSGSKSMRVDYETGTGTYGPGFGFGSDFLPGEGFFDATGTLALQMWLKAPRGLIFQVCLKEGTVNGADGEFYLAPQDTGTGSWHRYSFPYSQFTRSIYSGNQAGDDTFEVSCIVGMQIQLNQNAGDGTLWIDDIYFR
ncbi:MAG: hypothetical protein ACREKE_00195 [bacterium]